MTQTKEAKWISIWAWVGLVLLVYGLLITGSGVYYAATGMPHTVLGETNPCLWWGIITAVAGVVFSLIGYYAEKGK